MRIAILSESSADEAALRLLVDAVLGIRTQCVDVNLKSRGYPSVRNVLPAVIRFLQYQTEADALVTVIDSDHTSLIGGPKNRLTELNNIVRETLSSLGPVHARPKLRVALGVCSPAIEAWLLSPRMPHITEQAWEDGLRQNREPYSKRELKKELYKVDYPGLEHMRSKMIDAAGHAAASLGHLENAFPNGFGNLAKELRSWRSLG
jgi:hypothetical protein